MFQPVGQHPPAVYWRRRLWLLVIVAAVIVTAVVLLFGGGSSAPSAAPSGSRSPTTPTTGAATPSERSSAAPVTSCAAGSLSLAAATGKSAYHVGDQPDLYLVVTNPGTHSCRTDLADKHIELRVFTGDVRVWGSHDCAVAPGTDVRILRPRRPIRVGVTWSAQTSVPGCGAARLPAQAGTYTLQALLDGRQSPAATFTIA